MERVPFFPVVSGFARGRVSPAVTRRFPMRVKLLPAGLMALLLAAAIPQAAHSTAIAPYLARAHDMLAALFDAARDFANDPESRQRYMTPKLVEAVAARDAFAKQRIEEQPDERTDPP